MGSAVRLEKALDFLSRDKTEIEVAINYFTQMNRIIRFNPNFFLAEGYLSCVMRVQ